MQCGELVSYRHRPSVFRPGQAYKPGFGGHDEGVEEADCAALIRLLEPAQLSATDCPARMPVSLGVPSARGRP